MRQNSEWARWRDSEMERQRDGETARQRGKGGETGIDESGASELQDRVAVKGGNGERDWRKQEAKQRPRDAEGQGWMDGWMEGKRTGFGESEAAKWQKPVAVQGGNGERDGRKQEANQGWGGAGAGKEVRKERENGMGDDGLSIRVDGEGGKG
jgi:hypothetical protein